MVRALLLLPICLFFAPDYPQAPPEPVGGEAKPVSGSWQPLLGLLAVTPPAHFPADVPWPALAQSGRAASLRKLPFGDPLVFLEKCMERYDREVQGYECIMMKQDRVGKRLNSPEIIRAYFKERPFSVFMRWLQGGHGALCVLYVQGKYNNKMLVLPSILPGLIKVKEYDPEGKEARESGRYPITEFGIKIGTERTLKAWREARAQHALHVDFLGVYYVPKAGDRECYKLHRSRYAQPEEDGIMDYILYVDCETWLQVGSELRDAQGQLIGEYYFRDIRINPPFAPNQFDRSALKP
jgi:hypothetical protein